MIELYLIRHCQTSGQEPEAILTPVGVTQANELASKLSRIKFKRIISSHYTRAVQTAEPIAQALGVKLEIDERLCERNLGLVEGEDWRRQLEKTFDDYDLTFPNGESSREATSRAMLAVNEAIASAEYPIALVTHGNLLSLIGRAFDPTLGYAFWKQLKSPDVFEVQLEKPGRVSRVAL
jgi:2,3-bisphosphoglycerate-dependent phosphoglycerate mutase